METNKILRIIPTMQSIALAKRNLRLIEKRKIKSKDLVSQGVENIIGTSLIKEQARFLEVD